MGKRRRSNQPRRTAAEPPRVDIRESGLDDPVERLMEWQEHRYDPGYYTGGKIHPLLRARRPNKSGYVLIVCGLLYTIPMILTLRSDPMPWYPILVWAPILVLIVLAGFRLIRGERKGPTKAPTAKKARNR
jgi:hypothetical protein